MLMKMLHQRCTDLKQELREALSKHCTEMTFKPVQRKYAFDDGRVPHGAQWVLKVSCNAAPGSVPSGITGRNFSAILGTTQTPLEMLQLKRRIMGPSWLCLQAPEQVDCQSQLSWCKVCHTLVCCVSAAVHALRRLSSHKAGAGQKPAYGQICS
eukprot:jgi/Ulvmu1/4533/UM002_0259.1